MKYAFAVIAAGAVVAAACIVMLEINKAQKEEQPVQATQPAQTAPAPSQSPDDEALKGLKIN